MHRLNCNEWLIFCAQAIDETVAKIADNPALVSLVVAALLVEAVARVVKNELNMLMREKAKELGLPLEVPYRKVVVDYLNHVFGRGKSQDRWWQEQLPPLLEKFFNVKLGSRFFLVRFLKIS